MVSSRPKDIPHPLACSQGQWSLSIFSSVYISLLHLNLINDCVSVDLGEYVRICSFASDCVWYSSRWIFWRLLESFPLIGEEGCEVFHFLWLSRRGFIWVRSAYCGYLNMDMGVIRVCIGT